MEVFEFEPFSRIVSVVLASAYASYVYNFLVTKAKLEETRAFILVMASAALVHALANFLLVDLPRHSTVLRRLFYRTASIEGYWFQHISSPDKPYSVICIEYQPRSHSYTYHGINYMADEVNRNAMFSSWPTKIEAVENGVNFYFGGTIQSSSVPENQPVGTAQGFGRIWFHTEGSGKYIRGDGEFFERNPEPNWRAFELSKIDNEDVRQALGKPNATDIQDYALLLDFCIKRERLKDLERLANRPQILKPAIPPSVLLESQEKTRRSAEKAVLTPLRSPNEIDVEPTTAASSELSPSSGGPPPEEIPPTRRQAKPGKEENDVGGSQ